jgi:hypothetical protein
MLQQKKIMYLLFTFSMILFDFLEIFNQISGSRRTAISCKSASAFSPRSQRSITDTYIDFSSNQHSGKILFSVYTIEFLCNALPFVFFLHSGG